VKKKWKILILLGLLLLVAGGVFASIQYSQRGIVTVQTGKVARQDLAAIVTASGEIKPRNYINVSANSMGPLKGIYVKEGDHVRKGQVLASIESIQPTADVAAQKAALTAAEADSAASEEAVKASDENIAVSIATVNHDKADLEQKKADFDRAKALFDAKLLAQQDFEAKRGAYDVAVAMLAETEGRLSQAKAQRAEAAATLAGAQRHIAQQQANLTRITDVLQKYDAIAPIDGVVTNLPVRMGETVVPGVQNSAASTIMTIADMSIITAEVKVDETDIVNVKLDQPAEVTIDAIPNRTFKGNVIEIGDTAIVRSTGLAASQSTTSSQEAKDFKVVIALDIPQDLVRPGLSCTSKITTATRAHALSIPIQALTVRQKGDLEVKKPGAPIPVNPDPAAVKAAKEEVQGVFVVQGEKAVFQKVDTGITGATDIEVLSGLKEGDQIVTGSYKVIRTLRANAKIKVDNKAPVVTATNES
jgi:HlyD family secretion protein